MTYSDDEHVDYIMDNFDFKKVRNFMVIDNWKWAFSPAENRVPTIEELKSTALDLLIRAKDKDPTFYISTGGLTAYKDDDSLKLYFTIEQSHSIHINYVNENYQKDRFLKERKQKLEKINAISS